MMPLVEGTDRSDVDRLPSAGEIADAFQRLASLHKDEGCDLIILEMMYHPDRMAPAFEAALGTGLPVWAGFSAKRGVDGRPLSFTRERDIPFEDVVSVLSDYDVAAAGIMHTDANTITDALPVLQGAI